MDSNKEKQEISVLGRLFSMEALILIMGVVSVGYGIMTAQLTNMFFGVVIIAGFFVLRQLKEKERKERERNDTGKP